MILRLALGALFLNIFLASAAWSKEIDRATIIKIGNRYSQNMLHVAQGMGYYAKHAKNLTEDVAKRAAATTPAQIAGHQFQTILFISILSAVEIARENIRLAGIQQKNVDASAIAKASIDSATELVNSNDFWSSVLGAAVASGFGKVPAELLTRLLQSGSSVGLFKNVIAVGVRTNVSFLGWEAGSELINVAANTIPDDSDRAKALQTGALIKTFASPTMPAHERAENLRTFSMLMSNLMKVAFYEEGLRTIWLTNTWKNRIVTGHFATLVSTMIVTSAISAELKLRNPMSFLVTAVGATAWVFIPKETQNEITARFDKWRKSFWRLGDDHGPVFNVKETILKLLYECTSKNVQCPPMLEFKPRTAANNHYMSILFEEFVDLETEINVTMASIELAQKSSNTAAIGEYQDKLRTIQTMYLERLEQMVQAYSAEDAQMKELLQKYPLQEAWVNRYPQLEEVFAYQAKTSALAKYFEAYKKWITQDMFSDASEKGYLASILRFHFYGFNEDVFVQAMTETMLEN